MNITNKLNQLIGEHGLRATLRKCKPECRLHPSSVSDFLNGNVRDGRPARSIKLNQLEALLDVLDYKLLIVPKNYEMEDNNG